MNHLELVRVHETGADLVVRAPEGTEYLLPIDEALQRALDKAGRAQPAGATPSPSAGTAAPSSGKATAPPAVPEAPAAPLSPREIQTRIRAGATAQEVADSSGTPLENILRYEGPVLAERDYIARQAGEVEVSAPLGNEGYRAAFGDEPATLAEMVRTRLRSFGVDPGTLRWDAWKVDAGTWRVIAAFVVPEGSAAIGEEPPAAWTFHPARRHLENSNRWGQVLSEWEPWDVLPGQRRLAPVGERPYEPEDAQPESSEDRAEDEALLDVLTRRRGTRVGEDSDGDDALAHLIARSHAERDDREPASPAPGAVPRPWIAESDLEETPNNVLPGPGRTDGLVEPEGTDRAWPPLRRVPDPVPASRGLDIDEDDDSPRPHKKRRSQVPSWDEIVFGRSAKGAEDEDED